MKVQFNANDITRERSVVAENGVVYRIVIRSSCAEMLLIQLAYEAIPNLRNTIEKLCLNLIEDNI